jgi:excisionase family DNA binding protein
MDARMQSANSKLLLTMYEAATTLSIGRSMMYALVRTERVFTVKIRRARRVPYWALEQFVAQLAAA